VQSVTWYIQRLRSMSPSEVWWRLEGKLQDLTDRVIAERRLAAISIERVLNGCNACEATLPGLIGDHLTGDPVCEDRGTDQFREELVRQADDIVAHRLDIFDLSQAELGERINWNHEYKAGKNSPIARASTIDYRDYEVTGDCKFVWEPNRHHQLVVLGRAYRATGEVRYAREVAGQLSDWIEQCPFGLGMNWRSPLELGIRLINWVWALELIRPAEVISSDLNKRLLVSVFQHLSEITRKYSRYSSANNHLIGEAAGVFIASSYFKGLKSARQWRAESREILSREILRQTYEDGGGREQALGYHLFVLQFFTFAGLVARNAGCDFEREYWERLERMFEFIGVMAEGGESLPMIGDCDDGYVLDLGDRPHIVHSYMSVGAVLFDRPDFKTMGSEFSQVGFWLLGPGAHECFEMLADAGAGPGIGSRAFPDSGYYLLQHGRRDQSDRLSVVFDCGELGFESIAAHGHSDALSLTLRAFGVDVLVDPGTYDYFTHGDWRDYFRSTRAHNTVVVDDVDQSEMLGSFLWGKKAQATCKLWAPSACGGRVVGQHDGYTRFEDPVVHHRAVTLDEDLLVVEDEIIAKGDHEVSIHWHLGEQCHIEALGNNRYEVDCGAGKVVMDLDSRLDVELFRGSEEPKLGWVSRGYHSKKPSTTLVGRCRCEGSLSLVTRVFMVSLHIRQDGACNHGMLVRG